MVDTNEKNYFIWNNDWYEGEKYVALIDFFPVSEAINPSAERKKGRWNQIISIPNDMCGRYYCSECGKEGNPFWYFCPYCGADMKGETE